MFLPHTMANMYHNPRRFGSQEGNAENWCETCDRDFPTAEALSRHKQQHQKCNIDGCQFVAHPKVITKHIQMQHSSGLYKKIANLQNPEDIQKWRDERKKKYPTRINIEKKAAECKEKVERGEKMALMKDRKRNHQFSEKTASMKRTHSFGQKNQNHRPNKSNYFQRQNNTASKDHGPPLKKVPKILPKIPNVVEKNKLLPFTGILSICIDDGDDNIPENISGSENIECIIEDDDYEKQVEQPIEKVIQDPVLCGALTSLLCDYGSSDEENDNTMPGNAKVSENPRNSDSITNNEHIVNKCNTSQNVNVVNNHEKIDLKAVPNAIVNRLHIDSQVNNSEALTNNDGQDSDNDGPEEVKIVKTVLESSSAEVVQNNAIPTSEIVKNRTQPLNEKKRASLQNGHRHNYKHKIPSTLLQKLLHKEIRQERNIVLQCIRHIKKMNYFDQV